MIRYNSHLSQAQIDAMRRVYDRDGIKPAEQIRRALNEWLERRGEDVKAERKQAATRKRS